MSVKKLPQFTADDWGLSPGVNAGILELAKRGVVKRISCMANAPFLKEGLKDLLQIRGVQTGLHFNITYGRPHASEIEEKPFSLLTLSSGVFRSPRELFKMSLNRSLKGCLYQETKQALCGQLRLSKKAGLAIHYIDGHHHIHLLPGLLRKLGPVLLSWEISTVRLPLDYRMVLGRRAPIFWLSLLAWPTLREMRLKALPCRYPTLDQLQSGAYLERICRQPQSEVIVHPARFMDFAEHGVLDNYTNARVAEFEALKTLAADLS